MLRIDSISNQSESLYARRLMQAYARAERISIYDLISNGNQKSTRLAVYDEETFCGCACSFRCRDTVCVLCLFEDERYCEWEYHVIMKKLLSEVLPKRQILLDIIKVDKIM